MDSGLLAEAVEFLGSQRGRYNIHSLSIVRHGRLVADASFWPSQAGQLHHISSITKVVTSTLIGIAIDKGFVAGVHERVLDFFPDRIIENRDAWKEALTIEHLLTMTSGLGGVLDYEAEEAAMMASPDWLQFCLDLPMTAEPGTTWRYSDPNAFLLSAIITQATGLSAHEFARRYLLAPLGITRSVWWPPSPQGISDGSGGLMLDPHDLARFGQLFLQMGVWNGRQVVSRNWVSTATSVHAAGDYGAAWATYPDLPGFYYGPGSRGQRLVVAPDDELVVAFSGGGYANSEVEEVYLEALRSYIFPAILSDQPLAADPVALGELDDAIDRVGAPPRQPRPVPSPPTMAAHVAGQTYLLNTNPLELHSFVLSFPADDRAIVRVTSSGYWTYDDDFQWAAGLDGIERFAPGRFDIVAAGTGEWLDEQTFQMDVDELGNLQLWRLTLEFLDGGQRISITMVDPYPWNPLPTLALTGRRDS